MSVIWKGIDGRDNRYAVSTHGRVKGPGGLHVGYVASDGYRRVHLRGGSSTVRTVHRLVALAFLPAENVGSLHVHHIDGNRLNNHADNLRWVTPKEHSELHSGNFPVVRGEGCGTSRLTENDVVKIRRLYKAGGYTYKTLGEMYNVEFSTIGYVVRKKSWAHI